MCCFCFEYHQYDLCVAFILNITNIFYVVLPFLASAIYLMCCVRFEHHRYVYCVAFILSITDMLNVLRPL